MPGWRRVQGVVFRPGDARFEGLDGPAAVRRGAADPELLLVNRNAGSGTRILLDGLLGGARPPGYANQPKSHNAVAAAVAQGRADWGVAIAAVAGAYGLGFAPLADEHYDFFLPEARQDRPAVRAFLSRAGQPPRAGRGWKRWASPPPDQRVAPGTQSTSPAPLPFSRRDRTNIRSERRLR